MSGGAEAGAGDDEQVQLLGPAAEGHVVRLQGAGEEVEGPAGLHHMEAHLPQGGDEKFGVLLINFQVRGHVAAQGGDLLEQAGGAHIAQRPARPSHGGVDVVPLSRLLGHQHIAQPLAGQGQGLGEGVAHDGIAVDVGHPGGLHSGVDDLPVRLVGDEVDGVAVLLALPGEDAGQPLQGGAGVDRAGGVVGAVDEHTLGMLTEGLLKGVEVDLEGLDFRGNQNHPGSGPLDKHFVLGEVGGKDDKLIPGTGQAVEHTAQRGGGPRGEVEAVGGAAGPEAPVEGGGEALPGVRRTLGAGVLVDVGPLGQQAQGGLVDGGGSGDAGVADGKVEDVLRAHLGRPKLAVFKQLADYRPGGAQPPHTFRNHEKTSSFMPVPAVGRPKFQGLL